MKKNIAKAIIYNEQDPSKILALNKQYDAEELYLPQMVVPLGTDPVKELKHELQHDLEITLKFVRILPDSWSQLVFLHTKTTDHFTVFYLFASTYELTAEYQRKHSDVKGIDLSKVSTTELGKHFDAEDGAALELFSDLYSIIEQE